MFTQHVDTLGIIRRRQKGGDRVTRSKFENSWQKDRDMKKKIWHSANRFFFLKKILINDYYYIITKLRNLYYKSISPYK